MKKSQLRKIIRDSVKGALNEQQLPCTDPNARYLMVTNCGNGLVFGTSCQTVDGGQVPQAGTVVEILSNNNPTTPITVSINSVSSNQLYGPVRDGTTIPNAVECGVDCNTTSIGCSWNLTGNAQYSTWVNVHYNNPNHFMYGVMPCADACKPHCCENQGTPTAGCTPATLSGNVPSCSATGTLYPDLSTCQTNCLTTPSDTYDCDNNYQCIVNAQGTGQYSGGPTSQDNLNACQTACIAPPPYTYDCDQNYQCQVNLQGVGFYSGQGSSAANLSACQSSCIAPQHNAHEEIDVYLCNGSGPYLMSSVDGFLCNGSMCNQGDVGSTFLNQITGQKVIIDTLITSMYSTNPYNLPPDNCPSPPPDTYDCDQTWGNYGCVVNAQGTGAYSGQGSSAANLAACQSSCVQPACNPNAVFHSWPSYYPNTAQQSWTWQHPQNLSINLHPQFTGNQTINPGDTLDGSWVNIYNATQGTYCEWCVDWDNATAGPFDGRTGVWVGGPYDNSMCDCCPGGGQPGPLLSTKPKPSDDDTDIPYEREPEDFLQERFKKLANIKKK